MCTANMMGGGLLGAATGKNSMGMAGLIPAAFQAQQRNAAKKTAPKPPGNGGMTPPAPMMK